MQGNTIRFSDRVFESHHILNSKNISKWADLINIEDSKYCTWLFDSKNCYDLYAWWENAELCYEWLAIWSNVYDLVFCYCVDTNCKSMLYCMHCRSSKNCFGCVGLHDAEYCIFNKQYTKEDYEIMVWKIIRHMMQPRRDELSARPGETFTERWEFFHPLLSPFWYNETVAQEYYPLSQDVIARNGHWTKWSGNDEAIHNHVDKIATSEQNGFPTSSQWRQRFGYHRSTYESPKPVSDKVVQWKDLPATIEEIEDSVLQYAIQCETSWKLFRIQAAELAFYRKHHIPLPRKHPDVRHMERMKLRR
jgi:hypothetical protein